MFDKENYPIDIVIPWVDGSDPKWLEEKKRYSGEANKAVYAHNYRDWGLLRYWFRAIEKNAPWARRIYFITWGHIPSWLNTDNPRLFVVKHEEYIPNEYLPTFSANTIELNVHRIPGLAEHFVYFNDDTFLMLKTTPRDFFKNGKPRDVAVINPIAPANNNCISHMQLTNAAVINEHFAKHLVIRKNIFGWFNYRYGIFVLLNAMFIPWGRFPGLLEKHLPSSFLKSSFEEVWEKEPVLLDETCKHRFRNFKLDVNQWLVKEWQICSERFYPRRITFGRLLPVRDAESAKIAVRVLKNRKHKTLCINDHLDGDNTEEIIKDIINTFEYIFPEISSFERA